MGNALVFVVVVVENLLTTNGKASALRVGLVKLLNCDLITGRRNNSYFFIERGIDVEDFVGVCRQNKLFLKG